MDPSVYLTVAFIVAVGVLALDSGEVSMAKSVAIAVVAGVAWPITIVVCLYG